MKLSTPTSRQVARERFQDIPRDHGDVIQHHSRSFTLAARFLPADIRSDVQKLYAWCRWCDDAVDEALDPSDARQRLGQLEEDVHRVYAGATPRHAASRWLAELNSKYGIPRQLPLDLLAGMRMDIEAAPITTEQDLELYCYRAAGTVGLMMCRLFGVDDPHAFRHAKSLGMAMQMTNIARDVAEDWERGRCYLPTCWGAPSPGVDPRPEDHSIRPAIDRLLRLADQHYADGARGYACLPPRVRFAIRTAGKVYHEIGVEIRRRGLRVMHGRNVVSTGRKLRLVVSEYGRWRLSEFANAVRFMLSKATRRTWNQTSYPQGTPSMTRDMQFLLYFGLSLTFIMAIARFALVGMNPKTEAYAALPWCYAGLSAVLATATGLRARQLN